MDESSYFEKVKNWNLREDYKKDLDVINLLTHYSLSQKVNNDLYLIGTGLGADIDSILDFNKITSITGIEPIKKFYDNATEKYKKFGAKILNLKLGEFMSQNNNSGIFIFSHSINHIPKEELLKFRNSLKKSFLVIINPNPEFPKRFWWTDDTILYYLSGDKIAELLNCEKIFDFFYNLVEIKNETIFLRNAIVLKTKDITLA